MNINELITIVTSFGGIVLLILSWYWLSGDKKKHFFLGTIAGIAGLLLLIVLLMQLSKDANLAMTPPQKPVKPFAEQFRGYSPTDKSLSCTTSKATGATKTNVITIDGLKKDGKSDNYEAIQKAIDKAGETGGGIVKLPKGTFIINGHLVMKDNVTLTGVGPQTIIKAGPDFIKNDSDKGYSIVATEGANNVTIEHLTADQQGNKLDGNSVDRFYGYVIHVHNSENVIVNDVYTRNPFTYAIVAEDSTRFCFDNNNTQVGTSGKYDQLDGIHILNSSFGDVVNNYVDQGYGADGDDGLVAHTIDGTVHDVLYAKNKVRGGKGGSGMQLALTNATDEIYNITIQNNEFWGSPRGIRTGYYGGPNGSVYNITIGGAKNKGNYVHDNTFSDYKVGDAINIYGNGIDPHDITVSYNFICKAGTISVGKGEKNTEAHNTICKIKK